MPSVGREAGLRLGNQRKINKFIGKNMLKIDREEQVRLI